MDVSKLSRRTAVLLGVVGIIPRGVEAAESKAERRRKRRRVSLTCPQCPPAPNCTLNSGNTCTCNPDGVPCVCDSCCPTPPVCPDVCPQGQACLPTDNPCGDDAVCVPKDAVICEPGTTCSDTPVCEKITGGVCHQEEETDCVCPKGSPPPES